MLYDLTRTQITKRMTQMKTKDIKTVAEDLLKAVTILYLSGTYIVVARDEAQYSDTDAYIPITINSKERLVGKRGFLGSYVAHVGVPEKLVSADMVRAKARILRVIDYETIVAALSDLLAFEAIDA